MTRTQLVTIWRDATGLPFHPGSATERGLRAVLEALRVEINDVGAQQTHLVLCQTLDGLVNTK